LFRRKQLKTKSILTHAAMLKRARKGIHTNLIFRRSTEVIGRASPNAISSLWTLSASKYNVALYKRIRAVMDANRLPSKTMAFRMVLATNQICTLPDQCPTLSPEQRPPDQRANDRCGTPRADEVPHFHHQTSRWRLITRAARLRFHVTCAG
jgi:hypothetical protein